MLHAPPHYREHPEVRRWPAALALVAVGIGYFLLSSYLIVGPRWLLLVLVVVLLIPLSVVRRIGHYRLTRMFSFALTGLMTLAVVASAVFLVVRLPGGKTSPTGLLRDGALIWGTNILVFALWYWEIDCGGPHLRHMTRYVSKDFLFPQMTLPDGSPPSWAPTFLDYLFLAFNTSAAFSPTDTLILSRTAKVLMMVQSLISITVLAVLISRAINTLQ